MPILCVGMEFQVELQWWNYTMRCWNSTVPAHETPRGVAYIPWNSRVDFHDCISMYVRNSRVEFYKWISNLYIGSGIPHVDMWTSVEFLSIPYMAFSLENVPAYSFAAFSFTFCITVCLYTSFSYISSSERSPELDQRHLQAC